MINSQQTVPMKSEKNIIVWKNESHLEPFRKDIKKAARDLHYAVYHLGLELKSLGNSDEQVNQLLKEEFLNIAYDVIREEHL